MERADELIAAYLDGDLDEAGQNELAALAREDAALRHRLIQQAELAGLLGAVLTPPAAHEELLARTMLCLPSSSAAQPTVESVMERIEARPDPALAPALRLAAAASWRWPLFWVAALVTLVLGGGFVWLYESGLHTLGSLAALSTIKSTRGEVYIITATVETRERASTQRPLNSKEGLEIEPGGEALLKYSDGTTLTFSSPASATARLWMRDASMERDKGQLGKRVQLESGLLAVQAAQQPADRPLIVATPHADVRVVGTVFTVTVTDNRTQVEVSAGSVDVMRRHNLVTSTVTAGQIENIQPLP